MKTREQLELELEVGMQGVELLSGGESTRALGGATFDRVDPFAGEVASRHAAASVEDADATITAAQTAFFSAGLCAGQTFVVFSPVDRISIMLDSD
jgi:hypothetical protein